MATCDFQALLDDAKCFMALPEFVLDAIQNQLLCNISGGGGGGGGGLQSGAGSPEGVVNASGGQFYFDTDANTLYGNLSTSGTTGWFELLTF